ncbi:hypothetical protein AAC387_Pa03g0070 [Persea americana]
MSLVFDSREIAVGPKVGYRAAGSPPPAYVSEGRRSGGGGISRFSEFLQVGDDGSEERRGGVCLDCKESASTESSSSISVGEESSGTSEGEEEVESEFKGGLGSMGSLEESLPIKRGLSNFFGGKSKSFASLSDAMSVKDLAKPESPFNKRRKILMAYKNKRHKGAFYRPLNTSMPNIILEEDPLEDEEDRGNSSPPPLPIQGRNFRSFKSPRSFSCIDLSDA